MNKNINQTYCETKDLQPINWWDRINQLPNVDAEVVSGWLNESESWVTCACGNQCAIIPRCANGAPLDNHLQNLGTNFYEWWDCAYDILDGESPDDINDIIKQLKDTLTAIEKRSAELINKIKSQKSEK